ncbi:hypothetical protein [Nocardia sp. NPDC057440]|uniref:hypothetical protein n=1 Tax=Nocardia sp. NPDC057440 TaxID=3346134 RepID=UPI0036702F52
MAQVVDLGRVLLRSPGCCAMTVRFAAVCYVSVVLARGGFGQQGANADLARRQGVGLAGESGDLFDSCAGIDGGSAQAVCMCVSGKCFGDAKAEVTFTQRSVV